MLAFLTPASASSQDAVRQLEKEDFFREELAPVRKPAGWDVTIVYFMDYQCPSCRQYTPDFERVLKEDGRVRVIYRDTPIFGPRSDAAAAAAIASHFQGRHEAMHHALMTAKLPLDEVAIRAAADKAGVNWPRLQRDLKQRHDDIASVIARNTELSLLAGVSGTPAFIIGDRLADGALEYKDLKAMIAETRLGSKGRPADEAAGVASKLPADKGPAESPGQIAPTASLPVFDTTSVPIAAGDRGAERREERTEAGAWPWLVGLAGALAMLLLIVRRRSRRPL